jgi:hypothetical protein
MLKGVIYYVLRFALLFFSTPRGVSPSSIVDNDARSSNNSNSNQLCDYIRCTMSQEAGDDAYEIRRKACNILSRMDPENEEERGHIDSLNESYSNLALSPKQDKRSAQPPVSSYQNGADVHPRISSHNGSGGEDPYHYRNDEEGWGVMEYVVQCISDACKAAASASAVRYQDGATGSGAQRYQDGATGSGAQQVRPTDMSFARGGYQDVDTAPLVNGHRPAETKGSFQQVQLPNTYRSRESL